VAPPLYVMITTALDKNLGIDILDKAIITIQEAIEKSGGTLTVKMKVCIKKKNYFLLKYTNRFIIY
jgi:translation initiation factor 2 alpha subunit (eIF-2alpha)